MINGVKHLTIVDNFQLFQQRKEMLKIKSISIEGVGPIKKLDLSFDDNFNIICGRNGIGKTTILDCLAQSFSRNYISVKKNANVEKGSWSVKTSVDGKTMTKQFYTTSFHPSENSRETGFHQFSKDIVVFKTYRNLPYERIQSLRTDPDKNANHFESDLKKGTSQNDIKNWFVHRHLWSAHENHLDENQLKNIDLAKKCFNFLNSKVFFSRVLPDSNEIMLDTPEGEIYFEYLSSGYKSCIAVLIGIIKEIEFRYKNPGKNVKEFSGIIFIDEIDLHLHPEWQAKIYLTLKNILPKAQVFTTTHSPHIIQVAQPKEIIPLTQNEDNEINLNSVVNQDYGCQGWSVEEILKDVMGMQETRTSYYIDLINGFNSAIDNENYNSAKEYLDILDQMLHSENMLRKILRIQIAGLSDND